MKVFIDTNVLISAALFPGSVPARAFFKAVTEPNDAIICDQNVSELKRIFNKKFHDKTEKLNSFLSLIMMSVTIVKVPEEKIPEEKQIRDEKDRPIFRAAMAANADLFLTGDRDFLESGIKNPKIVTPAEFVMSLE